MANEGEKVVGTASDTADHEEWAAPLDGQDVEWPDHFPDSCPPQDATDASGSFYRLVAADPPVAGDFDSHIELRAAGKIPKRNFPDDCAASGLSIFSEKQDAEGLRQSVGPLRSKLIAHGDITGRGVLKPTPSRRCESHHTWWLPANTNPHSNFAVVT